ncbi:BZ3500_MvSof-1268-A1-R1_Chr2-1g04198 [Microbotryum saponariae]|uniref:BZ3500_MvSof-1268-A1-R1_Chr2-1g04198 protein n=1 Tax=Microbotryum saponariae TaxID=289078 RepID=A0A2X0M8X9_9BASI|nr:BZ3500_MvSof-1268-A1-R1_Chr2-1g04198 [Microbotryum saponariae]SCZ91185.1 BZ3501_MvSof-1269-A2-R1_Chr2-1g03854 [Microbotryum saponariae]
MSSVISLPITLGAPPKGYKAPAFKPLSAASTSSKIFPAGPAFNAHARRGLNQHSFDDDDAALSAEAAKNGKQVEEDDDVDAHLGNEKEDKEILQSDPKQWKSQDHYEVLGLQSLRYKATDEQIKKAHRRKVLRHHPDKKASAGGLANDDSFFKCIAKAMEQLSNPEKRRQFDSVDEAIPDDVPEVKETTAENFYDLWGPVFEREGRFSKVQPVPSLGNKDTPRKEVEALYDFFYNIDSWRSFEYLDKDSPEGTDSRDEKRHQEKKNKAERARKKKEDIARVRELTDRALSLDPRIKQFKAEEKAARAAKKGGVSGVSPADLEKKKEEEQKAKEEEAKKAAEEAQKAADDKVSREAAKKAKAAAQKNVKKAQKAISALVTSNNYFVATGSSPSPAIVEGQLTELDLLYGALDAEQVAEFRTEAEAQSSPEKIKGVITSWAKKVEAKVGEGKFKQFA